MVSLHSHADAETLQLSHVVFIMETLMPCAAVRSTFLKRMAHGISTNLCACPRSMHSLASIRKTMLPCAAVGLYCFLGLLMDGPATVASALIGLRIAPHFDQPCESLTPRAHFNSKRLCHACSVQQRAH